jgi:16S rRNA G966 N2-methylase RsmD
MKRLAEPLASADLVMLDPPYGGAIAREILNLLGAPGTMREGARVVVEHHRRDVLPEACGGLARTRERAYGETRVSTYRSGAAG